MNIDKIRKDFKIYKSKLDKSQYCFQSLYCTTSFQPLSHNHKINILLNKTKRVQSNSHHKNSKIFKDFHIHYTKNGNNKYSNLIKNTNKFLQNNIMNNNREIYQNRSLKTTISNNFDDFDKKIRHGGIFLLNKNDKNPLTLKENFFQNSNNDSSNLNENNGNLFSNYTINKKILKKLYPCISKRIDILKNAKSDLNKSKLILKLNFSRTYSSSTYTSFNDKQKEYYNNDNITKTDVNCVYYFNESNNKQNSNRFSRPELFKSLPKPKLTLPKFSEFYDVM